MAQNTYYVVYVFIQKMRKFLDIENGYNSIHIVATNLEDARKQLLEIVKNPKGFTYLYCKGISRCKFY